MERLKQTKKSIPRKMQEEQYTMNIPRAVESHPRADLTKEERLEIKSDKKKKLKNSDFFEVKKGKPSKG